MKKNSSKKNAPTATADLNKCIRCGNSCCRYITVRIPAPRSVLDFDNLLWQLHHEHICAFKDHDGWYLLINNRCVNLQKNGKCSIYYGRPVACREHSVENCEFDNPIAQLADRFFGDARDLDIYCRKRFKSWERRYDSIIHAAHHLQ